jgi:hypothetical protein
MRANLEKTGERYSRLLRCLTQLAPFIAETIRPNSDFSDRTGEADFAHDLNDNVAAIAYRRISLQTCPPEVRRFVEGAVSDVDAIVVTTLLGGNPTLPLLSLVKSQLESRFKQPAANAREADIERQTEGIVVWLNADPELRRFIAEFAVYRLTPLWRFFPQRNANWSGFLSIFEYGARGPDDRSDEATTRALESLATDMKSALLALDPLGTLRSKWSVEEVLEKRDFHLEGWPFYRSIGFLWTEHPTLGRGFGNDFDATQLLGRAVKWRNENPQEAAWVPLAAAVATGDI